METVAVGMETGRFLCEYIFVLPNSPSLQSEIKRFGSPEQLILCILAKYRAPRRYFGIAQCFCER